jgi:hypothetical protein
MHGMWFALGDRLSTPFGMRLARAVVAASAAATVGMLAPSSSSDSAVGSATRCVRINGATARYCGPATARLSVFPGAVFRNGFCTRKRVDSIDLLQVRIGARSLDGDRTNDGLTYFSLGSAASASQPRSGNVIAYYRSKRWFGRIVSFKREPRGGAFVSRGVAGMGGRAIARFRC